MNREPTDPRYRSFERNSRIQPWEIKEPQHDRGDRALVLFTVAMLLAMTLALLFGAIV